MNITKLLHFKYFVTYVWFVLTKLINDILSILGYVRIYDIKNGVDVTINTFNTLDIRYPLLGVCRYVDNRYTRYIMYDTKISSIRHIHNSFSSHRYHDIKKIQIITKSKNTDSVVLDITDAKTNFFDIDDHKTNIVDIIKFYLMTTYNNMINNDMINNDMINNDMINNVNDVNTIIRVTRENFDDSLLEFITTCEEFNLDS